MIDASWIMQITDTEINSVEIDAVGDFDDDDDDQLILIDSGSMVNVCPWRYNEDRGCTLKTPVYLSGAGGESIRHYGQRTVPLTCENKFPVEVQFEVADVVRPIISVRRLVSKGCDIRFGTNSYIQRNGKQIPLTYRNGAHYLRATPRHKPQPVDACRVCPVVADPMEEDAVPQEPSVIQAPKEPTQAEKEKHNVTHLPFAPWCPTCVAAKTTTPPHKKQDPKEREQTHTEETKHVIQIDYTFLKVNLEDNMNTVLTAVDVVTGIGGATVVKAKGLADGQPVKWLKPFVESMGHRSVAIQSDVETSIRIVAYKVANELEYATCKETERDDHISNGVVKRWHRAL